METEAIRRSPWYAELLGEELGVYQDPDAKFGQNSGEPENGIIVEVARYIVNPGQALAYKLGALKIQELRAGAARERSSSDEREVGLQVPWGQNVVYLT